MSLYPGYNGPPEKKMDNWPQNLKNHAGRPGESYALNAIDNWKQKTMRMPSEMPFHWAATVIPWPASPAASLRFFMVSCRQISPKQQLISLIKICGKLLFGFMMSMFIFEVDMPKNGGNTALKRM